MIQAADGAEALAALQEGRRRVDLVISETEFDDLPYFEALCERAAPGQATPFLFLSSYPREFFDAALAGLPEWVRIAGFLQKPFTLEELTAGADAALALK